MSLGLGWGFLSWVGVVACFVLTPRDLQGLGTGLILSLVLLATMPVVSAVVHQSLRVGAWTGILSWTPVLMYLLS